MVEENNQEPKTSGAVGKVVRGGLQTVGGIVPFAGGLISAAAGAWSEHEQEQVNGFFKSWLKMLEDEIKEKEKTIIEIMARLNIHDEQIAKRIRSDEYQSLLKKAFRDWAGAESEAKRVYIRNVLSNAAATPMTSDDVVRMFLDWLGTFSELHFQVIAAIYNSGGITRAAIWKKIGKGPVREDSADADLYKLLIRDLSMGSIVRQHRETNYDGSFLKKTPLRKGSSSREMTSAFDNNESYELTGLGEQFVHYAMTELSLKIAYNPDEDRPPKHDKDVLVADQGGVL